MADHCPADAPCADRAALAVTGDVRISMEDDHEWWLFAPASFGHGAAILYCPWCGGRLVETVPTRCHGDGCTSSATHGPNGEAIACWGHAGDWPEVPRG